MDGGPGEVLPGLPRRRHYRLTRDGVPTAGLLTRGKRIKRTAKEKNGLDPSDLSRQKGFLNPNPNWVKIEGARPQDRLIRTLNP